MRAIWVLYNQLRRLCQATVQNPIKILIPRCSKLCYGYGVIWKADFGITVGFFLYYGCYLLGWLFLFVFCISFYSLEKQIVCIFSGLEYSISLTSHIWHICLQLGLAVLILKAAILISLWLLTFSCYTVLTTQPIREIC